MSAIDKLLKQLNYVFDEGPDPDDRPLTATLAAKEWRELRYDLSALRAEQERQEAIIEAAKKALSELGTLAKWAEANRERAIQQAETTRFKTIEDAARTDATTFFH